jgi:hypothetical protein
MYVTYMIILKTMDDSHIIPFYMHLYMAGYMTIYQGKHMETSL